MIKGEAMPETGVAWRFAAYAVAVSLLSVCVFATPKPAGDLAIIVSPWSPPNLAAIVATRAGATLVSVGRWPFVMIVRSSAGARNRRFDDAFISKLYRQGALIVFDAGLIAGCH